jgi:hypothetical protein
MSISDAVYPGDYPPPHDEPPEEDNPEADRMRETAVKFYLKYLKAEKAHKKGRYSGDCPPPEETLEEGYEREKDARQRAEANADAYRQRALTAEAELIKHVVVAPTQGEPVTPSPPTANQPTQQPKSQRKKGGRPKKNEKDSPTKVLAALCKHHGYEPGGSVTNVEPATNRGLAAQYNKGVTGRARMGNNALTRFLDAKYAKDGGKGHKRYEIACRQGTIGAMLALWCGELSLHVPDLLPGEYGRGGDGDDDADD